MYFLTILNVVNLSVFLSFATAETYLLYANRIDIRLLDVESDNSRSVISNLEDATAVDFIYDEQYLFWADYSRNTITRTSLNVSQGNSGEDIISSTVEGLAADWIGRNIYWTDGESRQIKVANFDGSLKKVLILDDIDKPRAIVLDPVNGYMYWTDWGEVPKIERAGMDGTRRSVIIDDNVEWPNGLTIDYEESRLFFADAKRAFIHSCDFDGSNRLSVIEGADSIPHSYALTVFADTVYWTDWKESGIISCNKYDGSRRTVVEDNISSVMDIRVYSAERQPSSFNPCTVNNGGCSHLCLMAPNEFHHSCACPTGVLLLEDQLTCADGPQEFLLVARRVDIRQISLDTPEFIDVVIEDKELVNVIAVDYDPVDGVMYWTDDEYKYKSIRRAKLDDSDGEVIVQDDPFNADGIAVDWVARNLYWTEAGSDTIGVSRLNGSSRCVLIDENLNEPRGIAIDPKNGYMYWTDWGENARIERAALDGSDREVLIDTSIGWPNGIAIDYEQQRICWGDAKTDMIECADVDGRNREVLLDLGGGTHIFGITLLGDYVYWTDWQRRSIERVNKNNGADREIVIDSLPLLMGLKAIDVNQKLGTNACSENNGGCGNLCLYTPSGVVCKCPTGLELHADKKTCIEPLPMLVVVHQNSGLHLLGLETNSSNVPINIPEADHASAIDFELENDRIFWTSKKTKQIMTAFMDGSGYDVIIKNGIGFPEDIAVDWIAKNIYWTDSDKNCIEVARFDGSSRRLLIWEYVEGPTSLTIDPVNGYIYWSEWSRSLIFRAHMDGAIRTIIADSEGRITGLTIDYQDGKLFWIDVDQREIYSAYLDGSKKRILAQSDISSPFGLAQYNDFIYWDDASSMTIKRANKRDGAEHETIHQNQDDVIDIKVFHKSLQTGTNMCSFDNGGCSDLCLAIPDGFRCQCEAHNTLDADSRTSCSPPEEFILFSQRESLNRVLFDFEEPAYTFPINTIGISDIGYDYNAGIIFWINRKKKIIQQSRINGSEPRTIVSGDNISPFGMSYDPYNQMIFWSCKINNEVNVIRVDGTTVGTIIDGPNQKPRNLALMPVKGLIFWTNMLKRYPKLMQARIDGSNQQELVTGLYRPGPIAADAQSNRIYWFDSRLKAIEYFEIDTGTRHRLITESIENVGGLTLDGYFVYWVRNKFIERADKQTGENNQTLLKSNGLLTDVLTVKKPQYSSQPCSNMKGLCSHFCILTHVRTTRCSCPPNMILDNDEHNCIEPPTCAPDHFNCLSGYIACIPSEWVCDGNSECSDGSDELGCSI